MKTKELSKVDKYRIVKADYDGVHDWYDGVYNGAEEFSEQLRDLMSVIHHDASILDIGAGTGKEANVLSQVGQVTAFDISPKMLATIKEKYPQIETVEGNMIELPFPDSYFDALWTARAIIHIPEDDLPKTIKQFHRVLKQSAVLGMIFIPSQSSDVEEQLLDEPSSPNGEKLLYYRNLYPIPYMSQQLASNGFSVMRQEVFPDRDGENVAYLRAIRL